MQGITIDSLEADSFGKSEKQYQPIAPYVDLHVNVQSYCSEKDIMGSQGANAYVRAMEVWFSLKI